MSLTTDRADILGLATQLRPILLEARWDHWRRMGLAGAQGEAVTQSFGHPMPVDAQGNAGDALDRRINGAEKAYASALGEARRQLDLALAIQQGWLIPAHVANEEERAEASDLGVDCLCCSRPIAATPADPIREGFCDACSKAWRRAGKPDRVRFIKERRAWLAMPMVEVAQG